MKLLFTCVGRRVELMQAFRSAAQNLDIELKIYGADIVKSAPALYYCDHTVIVPRINDVSYIPTLQAICASEKIDALIPTIDTDLLLLAEHANEFPSTKVIISTADKIRLCRDKRLTFNFFHALGLESPKPVDSVEAYCGSFPAFIKPKDGSSSINAFKANTKKELISFAQYVPDYIIQPFIDGTEYTVDIFCDFEGKPIYITPRIRWAVRAGEVLKTEIDQDRKIISEIMQLVKKFNPCGPITVQLIREKSTAIDYYIEINPRFGGGAPLSMKAGANSAEAMLRMLAGETLNYYPDAATNGAIYSRFDQSIRVK